MFILKCFLFRWHLYGGRDQSYSLFLKLTFDLRLMITKESLLFLFNFFFISTFFKKKAMRRFYEIIILDVGIREIIEIKGIHFKIPLTSNLNENCKESKWRKSLLLVTYDISRSH